MNMVSVPPGHPRNIYDNKTLQDGKAMCTSVTLWVMMMALPLFHAANSSDFSYFYKSYNNQI